MKYTVFGRPGCMWCDKALDLLSSKDIEFEYVNILENPTAKQFISAQGHKTVPQIYYDEGEGQIYVGGYTDLEKALHTAEESSQQVQAIEPTEVPDIPPADPESEERVLDKLPVPKECHYCGGDVRLVNNKEIYGGQSYGVWPLAYLCGKCKAYVGVHRNTHIPMGYLADGPTREARIQAKNAFNPMWINHGMRRTEAYKWLADKMGILKEQCHIGMFDVESCNEVIKHVQEYMEGIK